MSGVSPLIGGAGRWNSSWLSVGMNMLSPLDWPCAREVHELSDRNSLCDDNMVDSEMFEPFGFAQVRMAKQSTDGSQRRRITPDWKREGKTIYSGHAAHDGGADASRPHFRNESECGQADGRKTVGAMLRTRLVGGVCRIAGHQGIADIFGRVPAERKCRVVAAPGLE